MFYRSIRFKFILWYMIVLTITLSAFSLILYEGFSKELYDDLDDLLSSRAEGVADSIVTHWQTKKEETLRRGESLNVSANEYKDSLINASKTWVEEKRKDPELMSIFIRILSPDRECIVSSKSMPRIENLDKEDFNDVVKGEDSFDTVIGESAAIKDAKYRLYSKPVTINGKVEYIVQVAGPASLVTLALNNLLIILFILLPLTIILAGIPGILLVRLTLRPVDIMVKTLQQITAENLKLKIHIPDTKDEIKRLAETFNDMIERLDRSFSSQQNFIEEISLELRAPLHALKKEIISVIEKDYSQEERSVILQNITKEVDRFSNIIENILILARFDNSHVLLEIKRVDLTKMLEKLLNEYKRPAVEKDIDMTFYAKESITIDGDEDELRRLFANLFDNAIKYTYRKGKVVVTAQVEGKSAKITVSDTGVGMPEEELPYIFDRFYQISKSRNAEGSFGLGLSIVKSVVEAHKGKVTVESIRGQGTTFTICLPLSYPV